MPLRQVISIPGAKFIMIAFFFCCALESTAGLWASSYLVLARGVDAETAARFASLFYLGMTAGRAFCGFIANRYSDVSLIRAGQAVIVLGALCMLLPFSRFFPLCGLVIIGLGCAPIYPCIIHSTPAHFGARNSQALIGVQMASAYTGSCLMPPAYGLLSNWLTPQLFPWFNLALVVFMILMHERLLRIVEPQA